MSRVFLLFFHDFLTNISLLSVIEQCLAPDPRSVCTTKKETPCGRFLLCVYCVKCTVLIGVSRKKYLHYKNLKILFFQSNGERRMKLVGSSYIQRLFAALDEQTILRKPNIWRYAQENGIIYYVIQSVWLIDFDGFMKTIAFPKRKHNAALTLYSNGCR